jgi:hypothetical protein
MVLLLRMLYEAITLGESMKSWKTRLVVVLTMAAMLLGTSVSATAVVPTASSTPRGNYCSEPYIYTDEGTFVCSNAPITIGAPEGWEEDWGDDWGDDWAYWEDPWATE